jgi:hypothetical protein
MKAIRLIKWAVVAAMPLTLGSSTSAQIVINEVVKEQRDGTNDGASVNPDVREYVELYNAGASEVDLTGWSLETFDLAAGSPESAHTIPSGSIPAGGYFVIGSEGVPNVNYTPVVGEIWTDVQARVLQLKNPSSALIDAVAYDVHRTGATGLTLAEPAQLAQIGSGFQGELFSLDQDQVNTSNIPASWSRYRDGRDTNKNGHDFGILPLTPGATNNLPLVASHAVPNVDSLTVGANLAEYHASFIQPRVIDPMVADANNPRALPTLSPQGGKAIVAWDPAYGGNAAYSKDELVNSFDLYAYFDTAPMGVGAITEDQEWESSIYGIGATDPFFRNPDPTNGISQVEAVSRNSSTGVGWLYQRYEDGSGATTEFTKLMLVDFSDGGDSKVAGEWEVLHTIDMSTVAAGWYQLGLSYDPNTDEITGSFNGQDFTFTLDYELLGTFFVGYREAITGTSVHRAAHDPPTFDMIQAAGVIGDYNGNNVVDAADYAVWRDAETAGATTLTNRDPANSGPVDNDDYLSWKANFGEASGSGSGNSFALVPEPGCAALALGVLLALAVRRRK